MPLHALENVAVDHCLPLSRIGVVLSRLAREPLPEEEGEEPVPGDMEKEAEVAELDLAVIEDGKKAGKPSGFACPECGGALWEIQDQDLIRFRCRVGHAWSAESLLAEQAEGLETALWTAFRALEENAALARRLLKQSHQRGLARAAASFERQVADAEQHAALIRNVLMNLKLLRAAESDAEDSEIKQRGESA
jgi:two-component system chemotaxis response regulator CheB